ncbi:MAG: hypothetical protein RSF83_10670 [Hungatella sp.]
MTEKELRQYQEIIKKIEYFKRKIADAKLEEIEAVAGRVKGSSKEFPYIAKSFQVEMEEPKRKRVMEARIKKWEKEVEQLEIKAKNIEDFIDGIDGYITRTIFRLYFLEGMKQEDVAKKLNIDQSWVSKKIRDYFVSHKKS